MGILGPAYASTEIKPSMGSVLGKLLLDRYFGANRMVQLKSTDNLLKNNAA